MSKNATDKKTGFYKINVRISLMQLRNILVFINGTDMGRAGKYIFYPHFLAAGVLFCWVIYINDSVFLVGDGHEY